MPDWPSDLPHAVFTAETEGRVKFRLPLVLYSNVFEPTAVTVWMSPQVETITGYRPADWVGRPGFIASILHPEDRAVVQEEMRASREELRPFSLDYRLIARSGRVVWVHDDSVPVLDSEGRPEFIQGYFVDVTERKELEERLVHAQRTEALGRLAAEVAHDFNNHLTAIRGHAEMALLDLPPESTAAADLQAVSATACEATKLTRQLLAFGRREPHAPRDIRLDEAVGEMRELIGRIAGSRIEVTLELEPGLTTHLDPAQLEQLILNLVSNARDAMPDGGSLSIRTGVAAVRSHREAERLGVERGLYAELTVSDTGTGIDPETLLVMFDPFFTTKPPDRGSGLGLSIVHGLVRQSDRAIDVASTVGRGTTVRVLFPAVP